MDFIYQCEICNQSEKIEENPVSTTETESSNDSKEKKKQTSAQHCSSCDDANVLLEQSFSCLFGFKNTRTNYLENHSVINIPYTLENCVHLYNYFKPYDMPEYDDMVKSSISQEVNYFLLIFLFYKIQKF